MSGQAYVSTLPANLESVEEYLAALPTEPWYDQARAVVGEFPLKLSLYEALVNAVNHGSRGLLGARIGLTVKLDDDAVRLAVDDPGPGFAVAAREAEIAAKPPAEGRGLRLIRSYMDQVEFNAAGNRITMTKVRAAEPRA